MLSDHQELSFLMTALRNAENQLPRFWPKPGISARAASSCNGLSLARQLGFDLEQVQKKAL